MEFKPPWWLSNRHLQTILPTYFPAKRRITLERERIELPDGDFIDVDWHGKATSGPIIIFLHGLEGSSDSHYAISLMNSFADQHWRCALMHFRGCSGEHNRLARGYHSGDTADLAFFANLLKQREPSTIFAAVGCSLGGNVLLKWLGETGDKNPLAAAVAISVPFNLAEATATLNRGVARIYQHYLLRSLKQRTADKFNYLKLTPPYALQKIQTIREFDDYITAPLHGFKDATDYYSQATCRPYLINIKVPTLIIHANDDPFMLPNSAPLAHEISSAVTVALSKAGGHAGFIAGGTFWKPRYWLPQIIPTFLKSFF